MQVPMIARWAEADQIRSFPFAAKIDGVNFLFLCAFVINAIIVTHGSTSGIVGWKAHGAFVNALAFLRRTG
jgi:hypothetical protein